MDFYGKYKSPFGYYNNANQIDSYGVNPNHCVVPIVYCKPLKKHP